MMKGMKQRASSIVANHPAAMAVAWRRHTTAWRRHTTFDGRSRPAATTMVRLPTEDSTEEAGGEVASATGADLLHPGGLVCLVEEAVACVGYGEPWKEAPACRVAPAPPSACCCEAAVLGCAVSRAPWCRLPRPGAGTCGALTCLRCRRRSCRRCTCHLPHRPRSTAPQTRCHT